MTVNLVVTYSEKADSPHSQARPTQSMMWLGLYPGSGKKFKSLQSKKKVASSYSIEISQKLGPNQDKRVSYF